MLCIFSSKKQNLGYLHTAEQATRMPVDNSSNPIAFWHPG